MSIPMHIPKGKIVLTYKDYVLLPNDGKRYEILDAELTVTPASSTKHQTASGNLLVLLSHYIKERDLGKLFHAPNELIFLEFTSALQPDLLFVSKARHHIITERAIEGVPDLVVEILSPTTSRTDRVTKAQIYARHSVRITGLWIPNANLSRSLLEADGSRLTATLRGKTPMATPPFIELEIAARDVFI